MNSTNYSRYTYYFLWLIVIHSIIWTVLPTLIQKTPPLDVIEALAWGQQWQWGYDKDPFLVPWTLGLANRWFGMQLWPLYLLSQLAVVICFWAVWRLAQQMKLEKKYALAAVLILEAIFYYSYATPEFNDNILLLPTWSLLSLAFYNALTRQRLLDWIGVGIFAGLALMAKYSTVMLLLCMLMLMLIQARGRRSFANKNFYIGLLVFLLIIAPNMIWLYQNQFITIFYAVNRAQSDFSVLPHLLNPLRFLAGQALVVLPAMGLFSLVKAKGQQAAIQSEKFNRAFIQWMCLGPILAMAIFSFVTGLQLRFMWATPLFSLFGIFLLVQFQPVLSAVTMRRLVIGVVLMFSFYVVSYAFITTCGAYFTKEGKSAQFPGQELATKLTNQWHAEYGQPVKYVGGSRWLAGNVAYYSVDRPTAFFDWDIRTSPWVKLGDVKQSGAIFLWDADVTPHGMPGSLQQYFPAIKQQPTLALAWRGWIKLAPIHIGVGFLAPEHRLVH